MASPSKTRPGGRGKLPARVLHWCLRKLGLSRRPAPVQRLARLLDHPADRSPDEWSAWRKTTTARVKALLANRKGVVAARELSRALLQDPDNAEFQALLQEAAATKIKRDVKAGKPDPWSDLPSDLRQQALELEGFQMYVDELEQLLDKAGFPPAPSPGASAKPASRSRRGTG
ncbi:hypothetical protein [Cyanobium sp. NIES-981]|uniref:hypothetical protein n=1 Tax=Cyanobium sp. NIES-981 TaxID=1851505 RepID=UPI0007DCF534|nr:hypothetical protein [Cyanobium sp. NIES-981]SBO44557.1 conserved protein of unknown function [Cyanobium sp. NIES-981]